jgi:hypothetical protein
VFNHVGVTTCDGAVAGGRIELGPPVESSDLDEKVLTTTPVRDSNPLIIWVESSGCIRHNMFFSTQVRKIVFKECVPNNYI